MTTLQLPEWLTGRKPRSVSSALANLGGGQTGPRISIAGNRFTLIDAGGNEKQAGVMDPKLGLVLDLVVADANPVRSRVFYGREFNPDDPSPPKCYSDNGIGPSVAASEPQAKTCSQVDCPHARWDSETSRVTGKGVPACKSLQKLAVFVPSAGIDAPFLLAIPAKSLTPFGQYITSLKALTWPDGSSVDISEVVTGVTFASQGVLAFTPRGIVDAKTNALVERVQTGDPVATLLGKNDKPWQGQITAQVDPRVPAEHRLPPPSPGELGRQAVEAAVATTTTTTQEEPPKRRPGRPRKEELGTAAVERPKAPFLPSGGALASVPSDEMDLPAFLDRREPPKPAFGMVAEAAPAPDDMAAKIQAAMRLPT